MQDADNCELFEENPFVFNRNVDCLKKNGYKESYEVGYDGGDAYVKTDKDSVTCAYLYTKDSASNEKDFFAMSVYKDFDTVNFKLCRKFIEQKGGVIYDFKEGIFDTRSGQIYQNFKVRGKCGDIFECSLAPGGENVYQFYACTYLHGY